MKLIHKDKFHLKGRGDVYTINLQENNIGPWPEDFKPLMSQEVEIDNQIFKVIGIESFMHGGEHRDIGLLVKPVTLNEKRAAIQSSPDDIASQIKQLSDSQSNS